MTNYTKTKTEHTKKIASHRDCLGMEMAKNIVELLFVPIKKKKNTVDASKIEYYTYVKS